MGEARVHLSRRWALFYSHLPPGLAELAARKYKQAAKCFLLASFDHCDFPEVRGMRVSGEEPLLGLGKQGKGLGAGLFVGGGSPPWGPWGPRHCLNGQ